MKEWYNLNILITSPKAKHFNTAHHDRENSINAVLFSTVMHATFNTYSNQEKPPCPVIFGSKYHLQPCK